MKSKFTAIIREEEGMYVAFSPELDVASQGENPDQALAHLQEAVELFLETASPAEIQGRISPNAWFTQFEAEVATA